MKKTVFVIMTLLIALMVSGTVHAKTASEYDAAVKSYYSGKYKDAVRHLQGYIAQHPDPAAYYLMGYSLYKLKRFDEANEYFRDAYLINPAYTPIKESADQPAARKPRRKVVKPETEAAADQRPAEPQAKQPKQEAAQKPAAQPPKPADTVKTEPAKQATPQAVPAPAPQQPAPPVASPPTPAAPAPQPGPQTVQPPVPMQPVPMPSKKMPGGADGMTALPLLMGGLLAGSLMVVFGILLAFYVFFSLCMYLIAKKLNVPAAWTAWVPLLNLWAFVGSAGKPWWWILLLFVPLLNFFIGVYLWLCITENLGKNKWLGLLMLVPIVNMIFLAVLAFSKDSGSAPAAPESELE